MAAVLGQLNAHHQDGSPFQVSDMPFHRALAEKKAVRGVGMYIERQPKGEEVLIEMAAIPIWEEGIGGEMLGIIQTMIQESTPPQFRGRVMSLHGITFNGTMPFAALASSGLAVAFGLPFVILLGAGLYLTSTVLVLTFAGGGIAKVVAEARREFDIIAADATPAYTPR